MIVLSGLFMPIATLPPALRLLARLMPLTYVVSLLNGIWLGEAWSAHAAESCGTGARLRDLHRALGESFPVGMSYSRA